MRNLLLLVLISVCLAVPALSFNRDSNWIQHNRAGKHEIVNFHVALNQRNLDVLESTLLDVSNPESPNYGKYWDMESVLALVAPEQSVVDQVAQFLRNSGCQSIEVHSDFIKASAPVSAVEKMFSVDMFNYKHAHKAGQTLVRSKQTYTLPKEIREHVHIVTGLSELPHLKNGPKAHKLNTKASPSSDPGIVVPATIQGLYGIPTGYNNHKNTSLCLAEFSDDRSYNPKDLNTFASKTGTPLINVVKNVGPFQPTNPDLESTLDVQYGGAIAETAQVWFWTVDGWMFEFSSALAEQYPAPYIVSMSWGWPEPLQCESGIGNCQNGETSEQYVDRVNTEFQKIGLRGITLLAASGDQGAPGDNNPSCNNKNKPISTIFPGASPWVTSVGATMLSAPSSSASGDNSDIPVCGIHHCATSTSELVCSYPAALITTGGGFSDYSPRPSWQSSVVETYLNSGVALPASNFFNSSNRGFPDVSALGHNYYVVAGDQMQVVDGTSCSSPVFGAIVALLNSYRFNNNKSPLGFINPVLYAAAASNNNAFTDITTGDNKCTEACCAKTGYLATKGWDPVTGLGTPNFKGLLAYVQTLQ
ncbi:hypothetical protein DICPUDRAFT_154796 [Dictyostelium purpureum]|uniref:Peptidase S53 domain-containing protein n=1 Tax=Dictyostelium purpureum TaxID=5786 RepID=F0ZSA3_DICPU|nr:uncharacterized protein DICPUDRAFT_154796 [Dictyostelium purpureum]EGC33182.1 hypothetical protein DICPUDRAFT_154796 [Dictyostelium purpureum]|eukprot:XP_003290302.1 hypothetical protein DICPUDRAFT_154796 [Dictyostelium purpureum]